MSIDRRFDSVLMTMAGQAGSLPALLSIFFSFLHRHTDFYVTFDPNKTKHSALGFPPGTAEKLLLRAFGSFPYKLCDSGDPNAPVTKQERKSSTKKSAAVSSEGEKKRTTREKTAGTKTANTPVTTTVRDSTAAVPMHGDKGQRASSHSRAAERNASTAQSSEPATIRGQSVSGTEPPPPPAATTVKNSSEGDDSKKSGSQECSLAEPAGGIRVRYNKDGKQIPIGNGGVTSKYSWTQTIKEATVYVDVPEGTRSKDVTCVIEPRQLTVKIRRAGATGGKPETDEQFDVAIDGELPSAVSREDSLWSLNDGKVVVISLEKSKRTWWASVVAGDPEIDTTKVDSVAHIGEYDEETQGTIRKIVFDQRQKALGLPSSDQLTAESILDNAKGLPGSPFLPGGAVFESSDVTGRGSGNGTSVVDLAPDGGLRDPADSISPVR